MSHIKQTQQTRAPVVKSTQLTNQSQRRDQATVRAYNSSAQTLLRSVSTRADSKHTVTEQTAPKSALNVDSTNILKRSLSKLRIKDASPNKQKSAQPSRQPLQPATKIPQATVTAARVISTQPQHSAFVVHSLAPHHRQGHLLTNAARQVEYAEKSNEKQLQGPTAIYPFSPPGHKKTAEVRMKAMQLGIFKISEADLKERYQFLNEIGAGEWGSVWSVEALRPLDHLPTSAYRSLQVVKLTGQGTYKVDNTDNFRPLAVKLCKRETKYSAAARTQRLWNEFKVLRTLMDQLPRAEQVDPNSPNCRVRNDRTGWHPNVVNFYEFLLTPSLAMLVMPKFDEPMKVCLGDTLCRNYFQQLLSAVHWLHQHCVCHNDIKVDNLGVTYDTTGLGRDTVTLFDFGFANRYDPLAEGAFMSKDVWGTPEYLAPERCRATLHDERKTDIWALGITFFEMLTGRTPFERHDEKFDTKEKFQEYYARAERGTWLGQWNFSSEMEDLIRKMLRHDPKERIDAAGALLHPQFDPQHGGQCDSFDELLQLSNEDAHMRAAEDMLPEPEVSLLQEDVDDSDAMIEELVAQTEQLDTRRYAASEAASIPASPGVSRAVVATHPSLVPGSPSLSQVGMDSRLTDLMCVSPPWRGPQPPRQGTPIPSAQRNRILTDSLHPEGEEEPDDSDTSIIEHSPVAITRASRASISRPQMLIPPAKQSPFRLRVGGRPPARPVEEQMTSTPLSAPAASTLKPLAPVLCPMSLPPVSQEDTKTLPAPRTELAARGNVVASLAKKFDASNFLSRPPPHVTALSGALSGHTGLGLTIRGQPVAKVGHGHRRSKSYNLTSSKQGVARQSVRRSTGSFVPSPDEALPRCARRLFGPDPPASAVETTSQQQKPDLDGAPEIDSARSDTKDAGVTEPQPNRVADSTIGRAPALHEVLSGDRSDTSIRSNPNKRLLSPVQASATPVAGEEMIFKKLKKMASLAGLLTKMIDETKSTILSPNPKTPMRKRGSDATASTEAMDISPGLLETPVMQVRRGKKGQRDGEEEEEEEVGDVSMVSAAYSLDLSGSARRNRVGSGGTTRSTKHCPQQADHASPQHKQKALSVAPSESVHSISPSPAQVESMYSTFLLSQNVHKSGSGFLSPTQPSSHTHSTTTNTTNTSGVGKNKHRSLAALFAPSSTITFEHLNSSGSPVKMRPSTALTSPIGAFNSPTNQTNQRSTGKAGKLARLFRKQT
ncbi:related to CHK1 - Serine/threonine kinase [Ustilago trichophora]|uniref:Related to CHK1 - Serine/threonine kinase n=1 Tax=Ustilago trichophora TaxID=86804 RepID=A0A5C3DU72_9BASI|nr:related to CHK1 - Serine/threonine kinase [Ustilago trichophora]